MESVKSNVHNIKFYSHFDFDNNADESRENWECVRRHQHIQNQFFFLLWFPVNLTRFFTPKYHAYVRLLFNFHFSPANTKNTFRNTQKKSFSISNCYLHLRVYFFILRTRHLISISNQYSVQCMGVYVWYVLTHADDDKILREVKQFRNIFGQPISVSLFKQFQAIEPMLHGIRTPNFRLAMDVFNICLCFVCTITIIQQRDWYYLRVRSNNQTFVAYFMHTTCQYMQKLAK